MVGEEVGIGTLQVVSITEVAIAAVVVAPGGEF